MKQCSVMLIIFIHVHVSHTYVQTVQVRGNLKVKLSSSNITTNRELEFVEPSVIGFIGECRVIETAASILEISIPHSSFIITRSLDLQKVTSVEAS